MGFDMFVHFFCDSLPMIADSNVAIYVKDSSYEDIFALDRKIKEISWLDDGSKLNFVQENGKITVHTVPYSYGTDLVVSVAKIVL